MNKTTQHSFSSGAEGLETCLRCKDVFRPDSTPKWDSKGLYEGNRMQICTSCTQSVQRLLDLTHNEVKND